MGHRVLLLDVVVMGVLRRELINGLGVSAARNILTRLGYAHGWLTAHNLDSEYPELLQEPMCGPILHTLQGVVTSGELKIDGDYRNSRFTVTWGDSYEAEQHMLQLGIADEPVCWTLTGYVSGYVSRMHGQETYCIERKCLGKGDAFCSAETRPKKEWGDAIEEHLPFFHEKTLEGILKDVTTKLRRSERRLWQLKRLFDSDIHPSGIIAGSKAMEQVLDFARRAAKVDSSVVITGESGVGKEMVARFIHDESTRAVRPFVAVNCSAVTEALLESEFFGHVKGAFTGAHNDRAGLFEAANGGTIFLDEIGDMSLGMQAKLLRVLQEKEVRRVGENKSRSVDVKVIAATNRNLGEDVESGRFRRDLYYRLCVIELEVPPLRERTEDILPLARFFVDKATKRIGRSVSGFAPDAVDLLLLYRWPGNVRELQNVIERSVVFCAGDVVQAEELPSALRKGLSRPQGQEDTRSLEEMERTYIVSVLEMTKGDKKLAARKLNISLSSLYRKLKEYDMAKHMAQSVLDGKKILAVDDEPDVLDVLKEEIISAAPRCLFETATTFEQANKLLESRSYDLLILDVMGVRGFDLLQRATGRGYPVPTVMLTACAFSPDALKRSIELGARAYLSKERLGAVVPFLQDVLTHEYGSGWKRLLKKTEGVFNKEWGLHWKKPDNVFWEEFEARIAEK